MNCEFDSFLSSVSQKQKSYDIIQPKFISATKWQKNMIQCLKYMMTKYNQKKNLIVDLITIVSSVPQTSFVQATLKIRPFKPEFMQTVPILASVTQSTIAETVTKHIKFQPCKIKHHQQFKKKLRITEKTLTYQFDKDYHPFKFIIKNFKRLLQLKFKSLIDSKKLISIQKICSQLKSDMAIFSQFLHKVSQPYKRLFKCVNLKNQQEQDSKFQDFIDTFLADNQKLNKCIYKIIHYGCKTFYKQKIDAQLQDHTNPQDFGMSQQFKIDGSYIRTINSLMEFSQSHNPQKSMKKLLTIRENILIDINQFYLQKNIQKMLQITAQVQIEIIRFCVAKLKDWGTQILAELKFLEYVYGEQQIAYKYQESSYMYSQINMAYQIMELES